MGDAILVWASSGLRTTNEASVTQQAGSEEVSKPFNSLPVFAMQDILNGHVQTQEGENLVQGGVLMGIAHRSQPHWGVQFHPESVATAHGETLMRNFFAESEASTAGRDLPDINGGMLLLSFSRH